ncbi:MAG: ATP-binding cassette domain-containing protein [Spirochaetes bacterium]|nr:ATP-binding cassette domain-containing protein [Spirochaetota bacterium]
MSNPFLDLGREHTNVFFLTLVFIFHLDGEITEREKEILSNFLRMSAAFPEEEGDDALATILDYRPPNLLQVLDYLKGLPTDEVRFFYLFQIAALTAYDQISPRQDKALRTLSRELRLGEHPGRFLDDLFLKRNPENPDVLFIGNDPRACDIMKCREQVSAAVVRWNDSYYFYADRSEGLVRFNQRIVLDYMVRRVEFTDRLEIKGEYLTFADLLFRFELKSDPQERTFHILRRKGSEQQFLLSPEASADDLGTVSVRGCRLTLRNRDGGRAVALEGVEGPGDETVGCLDNRILIENTYLFDLSQQIKALILSDSIGAKIDLKRRITVGNQPGCDVYLADGAGAWRVSVWENPDKEWVLDLTEMGRPVTVDGQGAQEGQILKSGAVLGLLGRTILFEPENHGLRLVENKIHQVRVEGLSVKVGLLKLGLHDIHLENTARDFVCVMGPSGCGKTTLLRTMAGYLEPEDPSRLRFNGHSLAAHFDLFKNHLGYVTQEDVLIERLTVWENMRYYGRIKAPHLDEVERERRIEKVLREVGLLDKRDEPVGSPEEKVLSGGEKRRLNIALELIADTDVLFLDEPTSGLSSFDSLKIIQMLAHLSQMGKIIYVVIHQPSPELYHHFTHLLLLDRGGYQAYFGKTGRAFEYFAKYAVGRPLRTPDDLLEVLEAVRRTPDGELIYDEDERGQLVPMRVKSPRQWAEEYRQRRDGYHSALTVSGEEEGRLPATVRYGREERQVQFLALFMRNWKNKFRDRFSVAFSLALPAVLALAIGVVMRYKPQVGAYAYAQNIHLPKFLFLTVIIFLFLAVSNAINEIFKDQIFLGKERLIAYDKGHYLLSKLAVLAFMALYQILIYTLLSFAVLGVPIVLFHDGSLYARLFLMFVGFSFVGSLSMTALTLFVSTYIRSEKAAFLAVPLLIVPQIIFGGMFLKYNELNVLSFFNPNRPVPLLCDTIHARWMFEGSLNLFRYEIPDKIPAFQTPSFAARFGTFNNRELADYFSAYNRASGPDEELRARLDAEMERRFRSYIEFLGRVERWEVSPAAMVRHDLQGSVNFFPYYRKIFYPFVLPTLVYNLIILLGLTGAFLLLSLARLRLQHSVRRRRFWEIL